jgi:ArsR family transcriptional regulator, arsenate/arsenite/antimonite-responsive transcriptional repressor
MKKEKQDFEGLAEKLTTIGHPVRLEIINLICSCKKLKMKDIYKQLNLDRPSISRHLNIMRKSGILQRLQKGNNTFYSLCSDNQHVDCIKSCFIE